MLRNTRQKAMKWTTIPRNTTEVRLKRLFLHNNPNNPPPDEKDHIYELPPVTLNRLKCSLTEERMLTYDFSNAYHNPRDPNQTFSCVSKLRSCSNTRPVHSTVERQLQAWRTRSLRCSCKLSPEAKVLIALIHSPFNLPLYAIQGLRSSIVFAFRRCRMVSEQEDTQYTDLYCL